MEVDVEKAIKILRKHGFEHKGDRGDIISEYGKKVCHENDLEILLRQPRAQWPLLMSLPPGVHSVNGIGIQFREDMPELLSILFAEDSVWTL